MLLVLGPICGCRVYRYLNTDLNSGPDHEYYASRFNDIQKTQIVAARKYGIMPLKDRLEAKRLIEEGQLKHIRSCKDYQLAPMGHSIAYLTDNAAELLTDIGKNFRDSLEAKDFVSINDLRHDLDLNLLTSDDIFFEISRLAVNDSEDIKELKKYNLNCIGNSDATESIKKALEKYEEEYGEINKWSSN